MRQPAFFSRKCLWNFMFPKFKNVCVNNSTNQMLRAPDLDISFRSLWQYVKCDVLREYFENVIQRRNSTCLTYLRIVLYHFVVIIYGSKFKNNLKREKCTFRFMLRSKDCSHKSNDLTTWTNQTKYQKPLNILVNSV